MGKGRAQVGADKGEGGVAGDDADFWIVLLKQLAEEPDDALLQRLLLPASIGKAGIVRDIDEAALRHQHTRLAQHGQPAYT